MCVGGLGAQLSLCFCTRVSPLALPRGLEADEGENVRLDDSGIRFSLGCLKGGLKSLFAAFDLFTPAAMGHHLKPE